MVHFHAQQIVGLTLVLLLGLLVLYSGLQDLRRQPLAGYHGPHWHHNGETLARSTLISSKYVRVESHEVRTPLGEVIKGWLWIDVPNHVNVLVEDEHGNFLVFLQTKYGLPGQTLAVCGGAIEEGETPHQAAQRELLEEMGRETNNWLFLGTFRVDSNRGVGFISSFLAHRTRPIAKDRVRPPSDDLEHQHIKRLTRSQTRSHLLSGHFQEVAWSNTVAMALLKTEPSAPGGGVGGSSTGRRRQRQQRRGGAGFPPGDEGADDDGGAGERIEGLPESLRFNGSLDMDD